VSRTVVIGLDHSDLSARALPFAQQVAQQWQGRLVLVHAFVDQDEHAPAPLDLQLRKVVRDLQAMGITADAVTRGGSPVEAILDVAREREADLIVMASHQRHGLDRWLHGSITEEVLARTATPLLVIPARGAPVRTPTMRVLVPVDGSPVGEAALDFLRGRSTNRPIELLLVQVVSSSPVVVGVDPVFTVQALTPSEFDADVRLAREYLARLAGTLDKSSLVVRHQVIEATDTVARVLLDVAHRERVDLIALGTHAKAGVSRLLLGSVSEEILERSSLPVLLVRTDSGRSADARPSASHTPLVAGR